MKKPRVIIADDHRMFAEGIRRLLDENYEVVEIVEDGLALIEAVKQRKPDLVLADISMPKLSGIEGGPTDHQNERANLCHPVDHA